MDDNELIEFEKEVAERFSRGQIRGPVHLSGGNETILIEIFRKIRKTDWVFSTWRNHYHALLHGIGRDELMSQIIAGKSMNIFSTKHRFFTSSIVGGCLPIAVGVAEAIKREGSKDHVWCFIGDMAASVGAFNDAIKMGAGLPISFVIENNALSVNTPTAECWPSGDAPRLESYSYQRKWPHSGIDRWVTF